MTDAGLKRLLRAIEKRTNKLRDVGLVDNDITDDGAFSLYSWLKKQRTRDVPHSFEIVAFDLSRNKIQHKNLKEIEAQLAINHRFQTEKKNIQIARDVAVMHAERIQLKQSYRQQKENQEEIVQLEQDVKREQDRKVVEQEERAVEMKAMREHREYWFRQKQEALRQEKAAQQFFDDRTNAEETRKHELEREDMEMLIAKQQAENREI